MQQHVEDQPPRVSDFVSTCPADLVVLVDKLLKKSPEDRPANAAAVAKALSTILEHVETETPEPATTQESDSEVANHVEPASLTQRLVGDSRTRSEPNLLKAAVALVVVAIGVAIAVFTFGE